MAYSMVEIPVPALAVVFQGDSAVVVVGQHMAKEARGLALAGVTDSTIRHVMAGMVDGLGCAAGRCITGNLATMLAPLFLS